MFSEALRPVWAEINMKNAAFNIQQIKKRVADSDVIGIIKANAYGHGAVEYANMLLENGVRRFGVATLSEAIELRRNGIQNQIVLLGLTPDMYMQTVADYNITPVVSSFSNAKALSDILAAATKITSAIGAWESAGTAKSTDAVCQKEIFVAVDTGMGRIGFLPDDDGINEIERISKLTHIKIAALFSHFATSDEASKTYSNKQIEIFNTVYKKLSERNVHIPIRTIANSGGVIDLPHAHFEAVRPGIILYGCYPSEDVCKENVPLKPVMSIKANITFLKTVPVKTSISYGCLFTTERESIIATLPLGYADGYPRILTGKARIIVRGQYAPVVGKICMDQCMADVTGIPGVCEGDEVIVMGSDGKLSISAEELGEKSGALNYEILSRIGSRIPRVYIE